jgi:bifunctional DNA-binding transcriptional regulator/antitoxin component of YhaV-PrlF toxin-antitoxin module
MNNYKFLGSVETSIDDKCRVTIPAKFRNKLEKPLKIEQHDGKLKIYESDDGVSLDAAHRLLLGVDNARYLGSKNIFMSGQLDYILVEDASKASKLEDLTPKDISDLYEKIRLLNPQ